MGGSRRGREGKQRTGEWRKRGVVVRGRSWERRGRKRREGGRTVQGIGRGREEEKEVERTGTKGVGKVEGGKEAGRRGWERGGYEEVGGGFVTGCVGSHGSNRKDPKKTNGETMYPTFTLRADNLG